MEIEAGDKTFYVPTDILTTYLDNFDEDFCPSFNRNGLVRAISMQEYSPDDIAEFLQALQQSHYDPGFKLRTRHPARTYRDLYPLTKLMVFGRLALALLNDGFFNIVTESLKTHWEMLSVEGWRTFYPPLDNAEVKERVLALQESYYQENSEGYDTYQNTIVLACANCPPKVFAEVIIDLDLEAEFRTEVMRQFALRHADQGHD